MQVCLPPALAADDQGAPIAAPGGNAGASLRARLEEPLAARGQFPLTLPFLDITPRSGFTLPAGTVRWAVDLAYESTHSVSDDLLEMYEVDDGATHDGRVTRQVLEQAAAASDSHHAYYVDGETARLTTEVAWGFTRRFEVRATLPLVAHTGGFMDGPIESYHEALGFPDGGRPPFARDQYVVGLSDHGRTVYLGEAPGGLRPGDLAAEARLALALPPSGAFALTASLAIELPTGEPDRLDGNGSLDAGPGLVATWRFNRWSLHAGAQYAWLGDWEPEPELAPRNRLAGFASGAVLLGARTSLVSGVLAGTGPFGRRAGGELGHTGIEIAVGIRHVTMGSGAFEAALLENILPDHNVPDVGLLVGWSWHIK